MKFCISFISSEQLSTDVVCRSKVKGLKNILQFYLWTFIFLFDMQFEKKKTHEDRKFTFSYQIKSPSFIATVDLILLTSLRLPIINTTIDRCSWFISNASVTCLWKNSLRWLSLLIIDYWWTAVRSSDAEFLLHHQYYGMFCHLKLH